MPQSAPSDRFFFKDNGSRILFIAHLDIVGKDHSVSFANTPAGPIVHSRTLDDRLGAYLGLHVLPAFGVEVDVLLTTGEELGQSTAAFFADWVGDGHRYDWMFQFDRAGTDVVAYDYDTMDLRDRVTAAGGKMGHGSFSDICYLDDLGIKGLNFGTGYRNEHTRRCHAYLEDTALMVETFLDFHAMNEDQHLPHVPAPALDDWPTVTRAPAQGEGCDGTKFCVCNDCFEHWTRLNERELLASIDMWEQR